VDRARDGEADLARDRRLPALAHGFHEVLDQRLVQELLRRPLKFVGMIGSVPKQRKFALRLRARGFSDEAIARLRTPLGMPIGADTPEEIAVSAVGELIAARRGASTAQGWTPPLPAEARQAAREAATPMLSVASTDLPRTARGLDSRPLRMRSATPTAPLQGVSGSSTTNSSPP